MENFDKIKEEIVKLQTSFADISKKYKENMADMSMPDKEMNPKNGDMQKMMRDMMDNMDARMGYVWNAISSLEDRHYQHEKDFGQHKNIGHLPKMTAGQLSKILKTCGMADDFEVEKPTIYASTNGRKLNFVAEYKKPIV